MYKYFKRVSAEEPGPVESFGGLKLPGGVGQLDSEISTFGGFFVLLLNTIFVVGISLAFLFVLIGGIKIITSQGDEQKLAEGKGTVTNAVIGFVIVVGYRIITNIVFSIMGIGTIESNLGN